MAQESKNPLDMGFRKIATVAGSLVRCILYHPETRETLHVIVDDYEYPPGESPYLSREFSPQVLDDIRSAPVDEETVRLKQKHEGRVIPGALIEVVKGRKYTHGTRGVVTKVYDHYDKYQRPVAEYCLTNNGLKINIANVRVIEYTY